MTLENFTKVLSQLFTVSENGFSPETEFKKCPEWNSLLAYSIIAYVEEDFEVLLSSQDLLNATTVRDLFDIAVATKTTERDNH